MRVLYAALILLIASPVWAATIASDTFTESSTIALSSHTPDVGTSWTTSSATLIDESVADKASSSSNAGSATFYGAEQTTVGTDQMDVSLDSVSTTDSSRQVGPAGRIAAGVSGTSNEYYGAMKGDAGVDLVVRISSSDTVLGSYTNNDGSATLKLELLSSGKTLYVDGVAQITSSDEQLTGNNYAGLRLNRRTGNTGDNYLSESVVSASQQQFYIFSKWLSHLIWLPLAYAEPGLAITPTVDPLTKDLLIGYYKSPVCGTGKEKAVLDDDGKPGLAPDPRHPCLVDDAHLGYWVLLYDGGTSMIFKALSDQATIDTIPVNEKTSLNTLDHDAATYLATRGEGTIAGK